MLESLLQCDIFNMIAIFREDFNASFAFEVIVKKNDYISFEFSKSVLKNQNVLIITLFDTVDIDLQTNFIKIVVKMKVLWIFLNEYENDAVNEKVSNAIVFVEFKKKYTTQIEKLDKNSWIKIVNNSWFNFVWLRLKSHMEAWLIDLFL